jgi:hypothetical protein
VDKPTTLDYTPGERPLAGLAMALTVPEPVRRGCGVRCSPWWPTAPCSRSCAATWASAGRPRGDLRRRVMAGK